MQVLGPHQRFQVSVPHCPLNPINPYHLRCRSAFLADIEVELVTRITKTSASLARSIASSRTLWDTGA